MSVGYLVDNSEFKILVERIKKLFVDSINNQNELIKLIDQYLKPTEKVVYIQTKSGFRI